MMSTALTSLWSREKFDAKRVILWTLIFTDAFFVGIFFAKLLIDS
jgi:hypothetical protein